MPSTGGDAGSFGGHAGPRTRSARPLPTSGVRRGGPYVGHGFRAPDPQDSRMLHYAQNGRSPDAHVLCHLPQADTGTGARLSL